jgi:prepilin-type N-terminal cleavage/methylation domain-containing protein
MKKGFTLTELLIVLAGLGILFGVISTTLKPFDIFKASRDAQRINDLNKINAAIKEYIILSKNPDLDGPYYSNTGYDEASSTIFISVPNDKESTSTFTDKNNKVWIVNQVPSSKLLKIDGSGWLPVNLKELKSPALSIYPVDPINSLSQKYFYSYVFKRETKVFELNCNLESEKYKYGGKEDKTSTDGGDDPYIYEVGSILTISPSEIYGTTRVQGLKPVISVSTTTLTINTYIGTEASGTTTISNTGSTTLTVYNITQKPAKKRISIDKSYITIQPGLGEDLTVTCKGEGLSQATIITTTLQLWNSDETNNPLNVNVTCNILNPPRISVSPYPVNIEVISGNIASSTFYIKNSGGSTLTISTTTTQVGDTAATCPTFITFSTSAPPSINIDPNSSVPVIAQVDARYQGKQNFECRYIIYSNDPLRPSIYESININIISTPTPPILSATPRSKEVDLSWSVFDDGGSPILYYELYRGTTLIATPTKTYYYDTGLTNGTTYYYKVRAKNKAGWSDFSNIVSITPVGTSSPPQNLSATSTSDGICYTGYIKLTWDEPSDKGGLPITEYRIYNANNNQLIGTSSETTFTDANKTNGTTYSYYVTAYNSQGESDKSNIASTTSIGRPCEPQKLGATSTQTAINLGWYPPSYDGGTPVNYYNIYMTTTTQWSFIASTTATSYSYTNVATNTYYFSVTAVNNLGEGKGSNVVSAKWPPATPPDPPTNLTATPTTTPANRIILNWQASLSTIDGYKIYKLKEQNYIQIATTASSTLTYSDYDIQKGIKYSYYVTAYNAQGESKPSNIASATLLTVPSAPRDLTVNSCALQKVNLSWNQPSDTGGTSISQYNIYRSTSTNYSLIGTTTDLFFNDYNPINNFINYYYVTATNTIGEGPGSNIVSCNLSPGGNCWAKTYGGRFYDEARAIIQTSDGGYILAGTTQFSDGTYALVIKLDSSGNIQWAKTYKKIGGEDAYSIIQTSDGGYILAGRGSIFGYTDVLVIKLDSSGNIQWAKGFGGSSSYDEAYSIIQTSDGGYILAGITEPSGTGIGNVLVIKLDSSGNIQWVKTYRIGYHDVAYSIIQTSDGGYILVGVTYSGATSVGPKKDDVLLIKTDSSGNIQWAKTYGGGMDILGRGINTLAYSIAQTSDGGYILAGERDIGIGGYGMLLIKTNSLGNIQWAKTYWRSFEKAYSIIQTSDGGYILAGETYGLGLGRADALLIKTDSSGNIQWAKTYGGAVDDRAYSIIQTSDGGYILAGETYSFGAFLGYQTSDIIVIKTNSSGNVNFITGGQNVQDVSNFLFVGNNNLETLNLYLPFIEVNNISSLFSDITNSLSVSSFPNFPDAFSVKSYANSCTSGPTVPSAPRNLKATPGNQQITLNWDSPLDNGGSAIQYYKIYRGGTYIASTTNLTYTDTGLTNGTQYCYYVRAVNSVGESPQSNTACATPSSQQTPPSPPQNLKATPGNQQVTLTWQAPVSDGGSTLLGYKIYRGTTYLGATTNLTYTDSGLTNGIQYCYYVSAYNAIGDSDKAGPACATPQSTGNPPNPPTNLSATPGLNKISLSWTAPSQPPTVSGYYIYRSNSQNYGYSKIATTTNTSYDDTNLQPYKYYYYVTAYNSSGESDKSNIASATPYGVPSPPQNLSLSVGDKVMNLSWQAPASNGGSSILEYRIYKKKSGGSYSLLATTSPSTLSYSDTNLVLGTTYYYYVTAKNSYGESDKSNDVSGKAGTVPSCPQNLKLESYSDHLTISWDKPASDGYYSIDHYEIWRKAGANGTYSLIKETTGYSYSDYNVSSGITYYYTVYAVNKIGKSTGCSSVSGSIGGGAPSVNKIQGCWVSSASNQYINTLGSHAAIYISLGSPVYVWSIRMEASGDYVESWLIPQLRWACRVGGSYVEFGKNFTYSYSQYGTYYIDAGIGKTCDGIMIYTLPCGGNYQCGWDDITNILTDGSRSTYWILNSYNFAQPHEDTPTILGNYSVYEISITK